MKRIVTHSKPDADAIAAAWLAETFMFPGEEIEVAFAPRPRPGQPAPDADCVVDIACVHDPKRLVFDHKGPAFADRNATCATQLVWEQLLSLGRPVGHLEALVRVVHEGDRSPPGRPSPELARSRSEGFHSRLKQARARGGGDHQVYRVMRGWLDLHDREERAQGRPARSPGQDVHGATPAAPEALDENAEVGGPQATTASPGDVHPERTAWDRPSIAVVPPSRPSPTTSDDGIRALGSLLLEYGRLCRQGEAPGSVADADAADSSAIRGAIAGRLARSEPGSKAAAFLRGLRVLVELERIAPGHLAGSRRGAEGWSSPLSLAKGTPGREASERVARLYGVGTGILEGEVRLAEAVEVIARNCGVGTLKLLLTPGGRLGVSVVRSIARKGPSDSDSPWRRPPWSATPWRGRPRASGRWTRGTSRRSLAVWDEPSAWSRTASPTSPSCSIASGRPTVNERRFGVTWGVSSKTRGCSCGPSRGVGPTAKGPAGGPRSQTGSSNGGRSRS